MGMAVGKRGGLQAAMNVTPLVDVLLVLLIIFMVMTPLALRGYDVQIPRDVTNPVPVDPNQTQFIMSISEQDCPITTPLGPSGLPPSCTVKVNKEVVRVEALAQKMEEIFKNRKAADKILFVAAQEKLNYEGVMQIVDIAKSGVEGLKMGIVTDEKLAISGGGGPE
jgi:biopolymer transport protein TolR